MANGKKSRKKIILISIGVVLIIALAAVLFLGSNKEKITTVQTEKVSKRTITQIVSATGKIQPETQVKITAEVSGEIIHLPVREGQRVSKGQLLARIKPDAYQASVERAEAAVASAKANLTKAEADYLRTKGLFEKKLVSDADMDMARSAYEAAKASYSQATASLKESRETLNKTTIIAPMDGIVSQLAVELGERVSGSTFTQGTHIMTIADLSRMEARVNVSENDVVMVSLGDTARVRVDAFPDRKFVGIVTQIANTATTTGLGTQEELTNFEVRILVQQPQGVVFRPGMSMTADVETDRKIGVLALPIQAVTARASKAPKPEEQASEGEARRDEGSTAKKKTEEKVDEIVFVVSDGVAKAKIVKRGISDEAYVELTSGVAEGMEAVVGPFKAISRELEDGTKVKVESADKGKAKAGDKK